MMVKDEKKGIPHIVSARVVTEDNYFKPKKAKNEEKLKFGDKVLWFKYSKKGNLLRGYPKLAVALDFFTVNDAVGICVKKFFELKYVPKEELKKKVKNNG